MEPPNGIIKIEGPRLQEPVGDLQDGMLAYFLSVAGGSDANIESKLDANADFRDMMKAPPEEQ
jgi:hypothetical protein